MGTGLPQLLMRSSTQTRDPCDPWAVLLQQVSFVLERAPCGPGDTSRQADAPD